MTKLCLSNASGFRPRLQAILNWIKGNNSAGQPIPVPTLFGGNYQVRLSFLRSSELTFTCLAAVRTVVWQHCPVHCVSWITWCSQKAVYTGSASRHQDCRRHLTCVGIDNGPIPKREPVSEQSPHAANAVPADGQREPEGGRRRLHPGRRQCDAHADADAPGGVPVHRQRHRQHHQRAEGPEPVHHHLHHHYRQARPVASQPQPGACRVHGRTCSPLPYTGYIPQNLHVDPCTVFEGLKALSVTAARA